MIEHENVNTQRVENGVAYDPLLGFFNLPQVETTAAPIEQVADDTKLIIGPQPEASAARTGSFGGTKVGSGLRLYTAEEFVGHTPDKVDWLCEPYVAPGAITSIDGKPKTSGKTTFVTHMCRSILEGEPFMGYPTTKTKVIYLTEQTDATFKTALSLAGLVDREDFFILPWGGTLGIKWPDIVRFAVNEAKAKGARLLVVDTLSQFAGIRGDGENDAGAALDAARPLQEAAACGLAVVVLRHERKSGGEVGDSGRGSSAFAGAVDLVMSLRRCEGNVRPTIREIHAVGRFHETPNKLAVELTNEGYKALGSDAAVAKQEAEEAIKKVLPRVASEALTLEEIRDQTKVGRTTAQKAIEDMLSSNVIKSKGKGVKGDPIRYWLASHPSEAYDGLNDEVAPTIIQPESPTEVVEDEGAKYTSDGVDEAVENLYTYETEERVKRVENALLDYLLRNSFTGRGWDRKLRHLQGMHRNGKDFEGLAENLSSKEWPNLGILDFNPTAEEVKMAVEGLRDGPPHYEYELAMLRRESMPDRASGQLESRSKSS